MQCIAIMGNKIEHVANRTCSTTKSMSHLNASITFTIKQALNTGNFKKVWQMSIFQTRILIVNHLIAC